MSTPRTVERFPLNEACDSTLCLESGLRDLTYMQTNTYFNPCLLAVTQFKAHFMNLKMECNNCSVLKQSTHTHSRTSYTHHCHQAHMHWHRILLSVVIRGWSLITEHCDMKQNSPTFSCWTEQFSCLCAYNNSRSRFIHPFIMNIMLYLRYNSRKILQNYCQNYSLRLKDELI